MKWDLHLGLPFSTGTTSAADDIGIELRRARSVEVSVKAFTIDNIKEALWNAAIKKLTQDNEFRLATQKADRVVVANALRITGLKVTFDYSSALSAGVIAKLQNTNLKLGKDGATLSVSVMGTKKLEITSQGDDNVYLLAAYDRLVGGELGFSGDEKPTSETLPEGLKFGNLRKAPGDR